MAITRDYQGQLGTVTFGAGTAYQFTGPIGGLGVPEPRTRDQERGDRSGDVGGIDVLPRRIITLPIEVAGDSAGDCMTKLRALKRDWRASPVDRSLALRLPGFPSSDGVLRFFGRPRGFDEDLAKLKSAKVDVLATFAALDPYGYGPEVEVELSDDVESVIAYTGDEPTDRWSIAATATTGSAGLLNTDDDQRELLLTPTAGAYAIDGRRHNVTAAGANRYSWVVAGSGWMQLVPGDNHVRLVGADGTLTYRPAYI